MKTLKWSAGVQPECPECHAGNAMLRCLAKEEDPVLAKLHDPLEEALKCRKCGYTILEKNVSWVGEPRKLFKLVERGDHRIDVLGGAVGEDSVYVNVYASYGGKRHTDLEPGESTNCEVSLSGSRGFYAVVRVDGLEE